MKYQTSKSEDEILPNKLALSDSEQIEKEEYCGFLRAQLKWESELESIDSFDWALIAAIYNTALGHLYDFADTYETGLDFERWVSVSGRTVPVYSDSEL